MKRILLKILLFDESHNFSNAQLFYLTFVYLVCFTVAGALCDWMTPYWPYIIRHEPEFGIIATIKTSTYIGLRIILWVFIVIISFLPYLTLYMYLGKKKFSKLLESEQKDSAIGH